MILVFITILYTVYKDLFNCIKSFLSFKTHIQLSKINEKQRSKPIKKGKESNVKTLLKRFKKKETSPSLIYLSPKFQSYDSLSITYKKKKVTLKTLLK
jgi:hypothetical protein